MPSWYYAPTQYVREVGGTYCPRHKNRCPRSCPYRVPIEKRIPVPLSKVLIGRGQPGFIQNYGMFGLEGVPLDQSSDAANRRARTALVALGGLAVLLLAA